MLDPRPMYKYKKYKVRVGIQKIPSCEISHDKENECDDEAIFSLSRSTSLYLTKPKQLYKEISISDIQEIHVERIIIICTK